MAINNIKIAFQKTVILKYLTDHISARCSEISNLLGVKEARTRRTLGEMIAEEPVIAERTIETVVSGY